MSVEVRVTNTQRYRWFCGECGAENEVSVEVVYKSATPLVKRQLVCKECQTRITYDVVREVWQ